MQIQSTNQIDQYAAIVQEALLDPDWFCEVVLVCPNDPWQSEMMNAIADLDRIELGVPTLFNHEGLRRFTIAAMHGPGKTHFLAKVMHWFNFTHKARIPCTAPKEDSLKTRLWPEFRKLLAGSPFKYYRDIIKVDRTQISWHGNVDWCALIESASQPENLAGYHDQRLVFVVEEASGVHEAMFPVIEGALTTDGAILVMIGNPTRNQGEFYNSHKKKGTKELYYRKQIQHHETNRILKSWVDGMIQKYGRNSPVVKVRVFGEFVEDEENQLISMAWLERGIGDDRQPDGSFPVIRVSIDVADGGLDETIITVAKQYDSFTHFLKQYRYNFPSSESPILAAHKGAEIFEAWGADKAKDLFIVDSLGVGAGTAGTLIEDGFQVITYKGGEASDDPKQWKNRRTQSYLVFRNELRDAHAVISPDFLDTDQDWEDFRAQVGSIKTKPGDERIEELMTKQEMIAKGIKSPDMADGCAMIYATQAPHIASGFFVPEVTGRMQSA